MNYVIVRGDAKVGDIAVRIRYLRDELHTIQYWYNAVAERFEIGTVDDRSLLTRLYSISEFLLSHTDVCIRVLRRYPSVISILEDPSEELRMIALTKAPELVGQIEQNEKICMFVVKKSPGLIVMIKKIFRTFELCKQMLRSGGSYRNIPVEDRSLALSYIAVMHSDSALQYVPANQQVEELYVIAVSYHPGALKYIPTPSLKICKAAFAGDIATFHLVPEGFLTAEICEFALTLDGLLLDYVPMKLRTSQGIKNATSQNALAHAFVHPVEYYARLVAANVDDLNLVPDDL